ncbi:MAG: transmembrane 220 family protein [Burkholderiaceae bacterium]
MTPLRILNIVLGVMMLGFTAVQYNDPDMPLWVLMYGIPVLWMYAVTFRLPGIRASRDLTALLWATVVFYAMAMVFLWPTMPNFWRKEVWIVEETAREGMGVMIAFGVMLVALLNSRLQAAPADAGARVGSARQRPA